MVNKQNDFVRAHALGDIQYIKSNDTHESCITNVKVSISHYGTRHLNFYRTELQLYSNLQRFCNIT